MCRESIRDGSDGGSFTTVVSLSFLVYFSNTEIFWGLTYSVHKVLGKFSKFQVQSSVDRCVTWEAAFRFGRVRRSIAISGHFRSGHVCAFGVQTAASGRETALPLHRYTRLVLCPPP
jgi:hypothetical protein